MKHKPTLHTLVLVRHASAASAGADGSDASRPLSPQGLHEAQALGRFLGRIKLRVDAVICSPAERAARTAQAVVEAAGLHVKPKAVDAAYNASAPALLELVRQAPASARRLMLVAHFPGVADLASLLCAQGGTLSLACPAATLAVITAELGSWHALQPQAGVLQWLLPVALLEP
ncbi:MAG TPA: histidine phosphatase family protein [bacterium]|nr:histidine phosphatase family protein [bacterium]